MTYIKVVKRELKRFFASPLALIASFIFPLLMCILICLIFGKAMPTDLPVAVLNADNSQLSRLIVRNLNSMTSTKVKYQITNLEEGKKLLIEGKIYGILVIPKNFQRDVYRFTQPQLVFYYNNQRILIGGIIDKDISTMAQTLIIGLDAKIKNKKGLPFKEAVNQSNVISVVDHARANPYFNYLYLLSLTAFGHIIQISMIMTSLWAIGTEFKFGTTKEWLKEADNSIVIAVLGKLTPYFITFLLLFVVIYFIYFGLYTAPYTGNILMGILATVTFIIVCLILGGIFISINGNFRLCLSFAAFYSAIGFALAGVTFPVMAMPLLIQIYTDLIPLKYWVQIIMDQAIREVPFIYDYKYFLQAIIILILGIVALQRLKQLAQDEKRWFQV